MEGALTKEQALRGITIWAAKGCFLEKEIGSIEPGKQADFIMLSNDLMKASPQAVLQANVKGTWVAGKRQKLP